MESNAFQTLISGGPVMVPLALASLLLYKTVIGLLVFVRRARFEDLHEGRFSLHRAALESGHSPRSAESFQKQIEIIDGTLWRFRQLVRSRLRYSRALLVAAPLLGLLGTVMGMLQTFRGLSLEVGDVMTRTVSDGISRALITTETGLMIAIPALFLIHWIKREFQRQELRILEKKVALISQLER
ncbi:MAG: MotA/TolQ/ExbB proton channel family protein [Opitutaceae bacterium]